LFEEEFSQTERTNVRSSPSRSRPVRKKDPFPPFVRSYSLRQSNVSKSVNINGESLFGMTNIREFFLSKHVEEELLWYILAPPVVGELNLSLSGTCKWTSWIFSALGRGAAPHGALEKDAEQHSTPSIKYLLHLWKARPQENVQPKQRDSSHHELDIAHALLEQRSFGVEYRHHPLDVPRRF